MHIFDELCRLGHNAVYSVESQPSFRRNVSPLTSESKSSKPSEKQHNEGNKLCVTSMHAGLLFVLFFNREDGGACYTELYPRGMKWDLWWTKWRWGQVFPGYFGFLCRSLFHQFLHNHHHVSSGAGTIGQKWPQYPKSHPTN
jgi:hypothetical protein